MFALYATIAHTRAARWAITGLIATVLDVTALARVGAAVGIAASVALAIDV
jgi:hypothetical protein